MPELWPQFGALARVPVLAIRGDNSDLLSAKTLAEMRSPASPADDGKRARSGTCASSQGRSNHQGHRRVPGPHRRQIPGPAAAGVRAGVSLRISASTRASPTGLPMASLFLLSSNCLPRPIDPELQSPKKGEGRRARHAHQEPGLRHRSAVRRGRRCGALDRRRLSDGYAATSRHRRAARASWPGA